MPGAARATVRGMLPWLALAAAIVLADQASKGQIRAQLGVPGQVLPLTGFFNLVLAYNRGAAFSMLNDAGGWQGPLFQAIALLASGVIVWILAGHWRQRLLATALALILGGALGNLTDRLRFGHVIDFLDFHWTWLDAIFPGGHFPAFNLADSAITCGAALLILDELLRALQRGRRQAA